jgi:thiamine-monophosphate kinase
MKEEELVSYLKSLFPKIGNDVVDFTVNNIPIVSTDSFVMGVHFGKYFTPYLMGYKSVVGALSDIAASGGKPKYLIVALGLPTGDIKLVKEIYKGMNKVCSSYEVEVIGGDMVKSTSLFLTLTVIGETKVVVSRSGAKIGDLICVTGDLGSVGLELLKSSDKLNFTSKLFQPFPRISEGIILANYVSSMIDISDGFLKDLCQILTTSSVGAKVYTKNLPIKKETKEMAETMNVDVTKIALNSGEEYELLFTIGKKEINFIKGKINFTKVGEIISSSQVVDENNLPLKVEGYDHFA